MSVGPWSKAEIQSMTDMALLKRIESQYTKEAQQCSRLARKVKDPATGYIDNLKADAREYQSLSVEASRRIAILKARGV